MFKSKHLLINPFKIIYMKTNKFSKDWWYSFVDRNLSFSECQVYKEVISEDILISLDHGVREMLRSRINEFNIRDGFRLYIDERELSDSEIRKLIKDNKIDDSESIEAYCNRVFGNKFGIITNYCEKHSEILANTVLKTISPLFEIVGIPPWGIELTTFIGNYGWTPIGIHKDNRGENVLHYHLGPGKKIMYVWDEDLYNKVTGGVSNNKDVEPLLKYAKKHEFGVGDLYYMPWNKYHIGYSANFSIGVTLWFNNPTRYDFSTLMVETIKNLCLKNDQSIIESQLDYSTNENTFNDFINTLNIKQEVLEKPLIDFFKSIYNEYKKCLMSNGGWQNIPLSLYAKIDSEKDYFPNLESKSLLPNDLFNIKFEIIESRLIIYVRGSKLTFKYFPELVSIINIINTSETEIDIKSIICRYETLPKEVILYFLKVLINNRGVKVKDLNLMELN